MILMCCRRHLLSVCLLTLATLGLPSCAVRRRIISHAGARQTQPLLTADSRALADEVARHYGDVHDFSATVDMTPAVGSVEKNRITEYKDVRGYILFRMPDDIRIVGLYPVVRNKLFDMVSTGPDFKLYIVPKNRFVIGPNEVRQLSGNQLENLRPRAFLEALLVRPVAAADKVLLENFTDEDDAFYILHLVREPEPGQLRLARTIWFSRTDLRMARQLILDEDGNILTDARYSQWKPYDNVPFPAHIEINRPRDEYGVVLDIVKMEINKGVSEEKFGLDQPPGTALVDLSRPSAAGGPAVPGSKP